MPSTEAYAALLDQVETQLAAERVLAQRRDQTEQWLERLRHEVVHQLAIRENRTPEAMERALARHLGRLDDPDTALLGLVALSRTVRRLADLPA
jgi:hypothetical protein